MKEFQGDTQNQALRPLLYRIPNATRDRSVRAQVTRVWLSQCTDVIQSTKHDVGSMEYEVQYCTSERRSTDDWSKVDGARGVNYDRRRDFGIDRAGRFECLKRR